MSKENFIAEINEAYQFEGSAIVMGGAMHDASVEKDLLVKIPMKTMNRHGLIAGATGTGKTKTLQVLAEQLSAQGVPSVLMDIKGDLSGIAAVGEDHPKIDERHEAMGLPFEASNSPVEFLSLSGANGVNLRATVSEFGPVLFSKILGLSDVQAGVVSVLFKYCDDNDFPLLDLKDMKKVLQYASNEGQDKIEAEYGKISSSSVGAIMRNIVALEQQGAEVFFGEKSFEVDDLIRRDEEGKGVISILRVVDIQDKPKLFSTFMLQMLAEIYASFPEKGDADKPELVLFIDEAHLLFEEASDVLLDQVEAIVKLIRSKGIGLFFVTQNPSDIPDDILGQLGMKIQHALRAFTAKDRKAIKLAAQNYPESDHYEVDKLLTELGIGEALITALSDKGAPTPLVHTLLRAPQSRMGVLSDAEIKHIISQSELVPKYNEVVDRESAYEILNGKIKSAQEEEHQEKMKKEQEKAAKSNTKSRSRKSEKSGIGSALKSEIGREAANVLTRGLLGVLGVKTRRRKFF